MSCEDWVNLCTVTTVNILPEDMNGKINNNIKQELFDYVFVLHFTMVDTKVSVKPVNIPHGL